MIALNDLEIFDDPRIKRLCCLPELVLDQRCDISNGTFSIDQRPDKCPLLIQMYLGELRFVEYLLGNLVEQPCILDFEHDTVPAVCNH